MRKLLTITPSSPISINIDKASENAKTKNYITGSTLRGHVAGIYLNQLSDGIPDECFNKIFLDEEVVFSNLYPYGGLPIPKTAVSCKRWKGFNNENNSDFHGVYDNLPLLALRWQAASEREDDSLTPINEMLGKYRKCLACQNQHIKPPFSLEPFSGFYRLNDKKEPELCSIDTAIIIRTGINRITGNVQHGILYNLEVIQPYKKIKGEDGFKPVEFEGFIDYDEADKEIEKKIHEILKADTTLRFGVASSRGLGKTSVAKFEEKQNSVSFNAFKNRIDNFNALIHKTAKITEKGLYEKFFKDRFYFTIDFYSDAILFDKFLRYKQRPNEDDIEELIPGYQIKIIGGIASSVNISGWNSALGMPKDDEIAVEKGSVILLSCDKNQVSNDNFYKALMTAEQRGFSYRKGEGFGRIGISDDFHSNVSFKLKLQGGVK